MSVDSQSLAWVLHILLPDSRGEKSFRGNLRMTPTTSYRVLLKWKSSIDHQVWIECIIAESSECQLLSHNVKEEREKEGNQRHI